MKKYTCVIFGTCLSMLALTTHASDVNGTLRWMQRLELSTPLTGIVIKVDAKAGQRVNKGDHLVSLDDRILLADVKKAKAHINSNRSAFKEAGREWLRAQELYERMVLSDHQLELARTAFVTAKSALDVAESELVHAQVSLEYSHIKAPFDAIVINIKAKAGETVVNTLKPQTLVTIARADAYIARILISASEVDRLSSEQNIKVSIGDESYNGKLHSRAMEPEPGSGDVYHVDVGFNVQQGKLFRVGQKVTVHLP